MNPIDYYQFDTSKNLHYFNNTSLRQKVLDINTRNFFSFSNCLINFIKYLSQLLVYPLGTFFLDFLKFSIQPGI